MLLIDTRIGPSAIHGLGLFATAPIRAGGIVWRYEPTLDSAFTADDLIRLSPAAQAQVQRYAFFDTDGYCMLCGDDARFMNHSDTPNCSEADPDCTVAIRDIHPGEELTVDYREIGMTVPTSRTPDV